MKPTPDNEKRRQPTLADRFIAARAPAPHLRYLPERIRETLQRKTRAARKFVFDDDAVALVAQVVRDIPELIVREFAFARAPFDVTWIEYPHWRYWRELGNDTAGQDGSADHMVGYLIDHSTVTVVVGGTIDKPTMDPAPTILQFLLNTDWPDNVQDYFANEGRVTLDVIDRFMWGGTYAKLDPETRTLLRRHNTIQPMAYLREPTADAERLRLQKVFEGGAGELRTIIAMLLMLNRPTVTRYTNAPPSHGWLKGKYIPYAAHTTVSINLSALDTMKLIGTPAGDAVPRRRHEVRGHYCHDRTSRDYLRIAGCLHDYAPTHPDWTPWPDAKPNDVDHWVCAACGGKRWWREEHERGDAAKGFVTHDYTVTA